jgi:hypothetical protein
MHFSTTSIVFFLSAGLHVSATTTGPWKCSLAQDGSGMPQNPYCCDENSIAKSYIDGKVILVNNCKDLLPATT